MNLVLISIFFDFVLYLQINYVSYGHLFAISGFGFLLVLGVALEISVF